MKKSFVSVFLIVFFNTFTLSSCHSENKEIAEQKQNDYIDVTQLTESSNPDAGKATDISQKEGTRVFVVRSVLAAKPGNIVDFLWQENGKDRKFSEFVKGKIVLLNFWGTWCPPCRREIPDLVEIHNESTGKDYLIVGIALERDIANAEKVVSDFAGKSGIKYLNIIDKNQDIARAYGGINAVPTTFVIDKNGKIVETLVGMRSKSAFLEAIDRARK